MDVFERLCCVVQWSLVSGHHSMCWRCVELYGMCWYVRLQHGCGDWGLGISGLVSGADMGALMLMWLRGILHYTTVDEILLSCIHHLLLLGVPGCPKLLEPGRLEP